MANDFVQQPESYTVPRDRIRWLAAYNRGTDAPAERQNCPSFGIGMVGTSIMRNGQMIRSVSIPYDSSVGTATPRMGTGSVSPSTPWILTGTDPEMRMPYKFAVNSATYMPKSSDGKVCGQITQDWPAQVLCDVTEEIPAIGDVVGPTHKSWYVSTEGKGFVCCGKEDDAERVVNRRRLRKIWIGPSGGVTHASTIGQWWDVEPGGGGLMSVFNVDPGDPVGLTPNGGTIGQALEYAPIQSSTAFSRPSSTISGDAAWRWSGPRLVAMRDTLVFMSVNCTVSSTDAPDGAELWLRLFTENSSGVIQTGVPQLHGSRKQAFSFRSSDSDGDYFLQFFSSENVSFSSPVSLIEGNRYYIANASAYQLTITHFVWSIVELPLMLP